MASLVRVEDDRLNLFLFFLFLFSFLTILNLRLEVSVISQTIKQCDTVSQKNVKGSRIMILYYISIGYSMYAF